jgi:hypothetical protein
MLFAQILLGSLLSILIIGITWAGPDSANQSSPIITTAGSPPDLATEINLLKLLLVFGLIIIMIEACVAYLTHWDAELTHRMIGLTLVVMVAVILIPIGYSDIQTAPIFGLLGMIVGYLLGSSRAQPPKQ